MTSVSEAGCPQLMGGEEIMYGRSQVKGRGPNPRLLEKNRSSPKLFEMGAVMMPISQMKKLRVRGVDSPEVLGLGSGGEVPGMRTCQ